MKAWVPVWMLALLIAGCTAPPEPVQEARVDATEPEMQVTLSWTPEEPVSGEPVTLRARVLAPAGDALEHSQWSLGGTLRNGTTIEHRFAETGTYVIRFEARTDGGLEAEAGTELHVRPAPDADDPEPEPTPGPDPTPEPDGEDEPPNDVGEDDGDSAPKPSIVVAVLDTGILAEHEAFAAGQVVAWYDFGRGGSGVPGEMWDPQSEPYDDQGHGTAVASMVAGTGRHTTSHAPGISLAVAKISGPDGSAAWTDTARAIEWAVHTVGADVITISFGSYIPDPFAPVSANPVMAALEQARGQGVMTLVSAGNGLLNYGAPTVSWMHTLGNSRNALVVGGAGTTGAPVAPLGSMDPELTALYYVRIACADSPKCYDQWGGTSFSTPLVAGMAAHLLAVAEAEGIARPSPGTMELLLKGSAQDTVYPPDLEGHGFLDAAALQRAVGHLRAGTMPALDPVNEAYVETVGDTARGAWGG